jgi:anti-sigma regulatory factor (Ser/Thr protein kinase)
MVPTASEVTMSSEPPETHCELTFSPNVELISVVRRFVSAFYDQVLHDKDTSSRLAVATHELLENACKYSCDGHTTLRIEVVDGHRRARILLSNRATPERMADIQARFAEMSAFPDPDAYYQEMMARSMKNEGGSGLGLARIRAEAEMTLALTSSADRLCIVAHTHIGSPPGPVEASS